MLRPFRPFGLAGLLALAAAGPAAAQATLTADLGLFSAYDARGLNLTNRPVLEPDVVLGVPLAGTTFNFGAWANVEPRAYTAASDISMVAVDGRAHGAGPDLTELDVWVEAARPVGPLALTLGAWRFFYPNAQGVTPAANTTEAYLKLTWAVALAPTLNVLYDVEKVRGAYLETQVSGAVRPGRAPPIVLSALAGWCAGQDAHPGEQANFARDGFTHLDLSASTRLERGPFSLTPVLHLNLGHDAETRWSTPTRSRALRAWFGGTLGWRGALR